MKNTWIYFHSACIYMLLIKWWQEICSANCGYKAISLKVVSFFSDECSMENYPYLLFLQNNFSFGNLHQSTSSNRFTGWGYKQYQQLESNLNSNSCLLYRINWIYLGFDTYLCHCDRCKKVYFLSQWRINYLEPLNWELQAQSLVNKKHKQCEIMSLYNMY